VSTNQLRMPCVMDTRDAVDLSTSPDDLIRDGIEYVAFDYSTPFDFTRM
jgi:hypothetical protein